MALLNYAASYKRDVFKPFISMGVEFIIETLLCLTLNQHL